MPQPGTYYLNMTPSFTVISGFITFEYVIDFKADECTITEPNQETECAATIGVGKPYKGYFGSEYYSDHPDNCDVIAFTIPETGTYSIGIGGFSTLSESTCIGRLSFSDGSGGSISLFYGSSGFDSVDENGFRCRHFNLKEGVKGYISLMNYSGDPIAYQIAVMRLDTSGKGNMGNTVISLDQSSFIYTGKAIKPDFDVKCNGGYLDDDDDYSVKYENNKEIGIATIRVSGKGKYYGTITKTFKIIPPQPKGRRFANGIVTLKKYKANVTGFQVKLSNYSSMKHSKVITFKGSALRTLKVSSCKLVRKKHCWAQIRAYKKVGKTTLYSSWGW